MVTVTLTVADDWQSDPLRVVAGMREGKDALDEWHPHQQLLELRTGLGQHDQGVGRLGRRQRPQGSLRGGTQLLATPAGESRDPVFVGVLES